MAEALPSLIPNLGLADLRSVVRQVLADAAAELLTSSVHALSGGYASETVGGHGTYRLSGTARSGEQTAPWSVILKTLGRATGVGSDDIRAWNYWKREILAYQSGLLLDLPGQISAPRCFGVVEYSSDAYWIWLEDIVDDVPAWSMADYGRAARHLGQFNGAYLAGRPLPDFPWLTEGRVKTWLEYARPILENLRPFLSAAKRPHWLTEAQIERVLAQWAGRDRLLQALDRLPRTFCHHDAFRRNLFARKNASSGDQTVAIDWQIVGTGVAGEELIPLVGVSLQFMCVETSKLKALETGALEGYCAGLRDAGWRGDERMVRFAYAAAASMFVGVSTVGCWSDVVHETRYTLEEEALGRPIDEIIANLGALQDHFLDLGDQAHAFAEF